MGGRADFRNFTGALLPTGQRVPHDSYHKTTRMKIGFVVSFFDFRNDVRRVIIEVAQQHEVVIFGRPENKEEILRHLPQGVTFRLINEKKGGGWNNLWLKLYLLFRQIPKSRHNFFLMELFKASLITDPVALKKNYAILSGYGVCPKSFRTIFTLIACTIKAKRIFRALTNLFVLRPSPTIF